MVTVPAGTKAAYESALENAAAFYYGTEWTVVEAGGSTDPAPVEKEIFTYSAVERGVAITGPVRNIFGFMVCIQHYLEHDFRRGVFF